VLPARWVVRRATARRTGAAARPDDQLHSDLQSANTTPEFSYIIPDNCSNGHDAVCAANNLSGGFGTGADAQTPNPPLNYTGGTYAESEFLSHVVPEIEASPRSQTTA